MQRKENFSKDTIVFHYNREDRVRSLSPETRERKRTGIFKSNRSVLLMLINILLVAVLVFVVTPILRARQKIGRFDDCVFSLKGFVYEERAFVSLAVEAKKDRPGSSVSTFEADIYLEKSGHTVTLADILPTSEGLSVILRAELNLKAGTDTAVADIRVGDAEIRLTAVLTPEK